MLSLAILNIPLLFTNVFNINKVKNVKRVCPERKIKGQKNMKRLKNENI